MNKVLVFSGTILILFLTGYLLVGQNNAGKRDSVDPTGSGEPIIKSSLDENAQLAASAYPFNTPKKSAHYESSTPEHGAVMGAVPVNIVINFNFDLAQPSTITITKDGKDFGVGDVIIDRNKLSMRRSIDQRAPDGLYTILYNACWPDGSCHDGQFQFAVDRSKQSEYKDLRNQKEVTIGMSNSVFESKDILVSKGTRITWENFDDLVHYVNTDSHPAHTYYPGQNSKALKKGDKYSVVFDSPGVYTYHCSTHAQTMTGSIIVE